MWIYPTNNGAGAYSFCFGSASSRNFFTSFFPKVSLVIANTDSSASSSSTGGSPVLNAWQHIAFSLQISGSNYILTTWLNGTASSPNTIVGKTPQWYATDNMYIGAQPLSSFNQTGYYQDCRIISGSTIPSGNFTPASAPFGTSLPSYVTGGQVVFTMYDTQTFSPGVYVSNTITTPQTISSTLNASTVNVSSIFGTTGVGTVATSNTLDVLGNIYISNTLTTTNISSQNANIITLNVTTLSLTNWAQTTANVGLTLNTLSIYGTSGNIGMNKASIPGSSLDVAGNVWSTNSVSTSLLTASNIINYNEDTTRRSIHLIPSSSNAGTIQTWISAQCNAVRQPSMSYWATNQQPIFSNVVSGPPPSSGGSVLLPDGRVVFVPSYSSNVGVYNPFVRQYSNILIPGLPLSSFSSGILLPNGNVLFSPQASNIGIFNPLTSQYSNGIALPGGDCSAVLTSNGVSFIPQGATANIIQYNYQSGSYINTVSVSNASPTPVNYWTGASVVVGTTRSAIAWSPQLGLFVAGGESTTPYFAYSLDGSNWITASTVVGTIWNGIDWSPQLGLFAAAGSATPYLAYSADGKNWTQRSSGASSPQNAIAWSPQLGLFVSGGSSFYQYSSDGKVWTAVSTSSIGINGIAWSPQLGLFVAVGSVTSPYFTYSFDGKNWTGAASRPAGSGGWQCVAWSPQLGIFVAGGGVSPYLAYSTDGQNWTVATSVVGTGWQGASWSPRLGVFIVCGNATPYVAYSTDGKKWVAASSTVGTGWRAAVWSPQRGTFALAGSSTPYFAYTANTFPVNGQGQTLLTSGNVLFKSQGTANVIQYDPVSILTSNITCGSDVYNGMILAPNGNVITVPTISNAYVINPVSLVSSNVSTSGGYAYGTILPSGNLIFAPQNSNIGMFDPEALTCSNCSSTGATSWSSTTLLPNGQVIFKPGSGSNVGVLGTLAPISKELCLSPYYNKF